MPVYFDIPIAYTGNDKRTREVEVRAAGELL